MGERDKGDGREFGLPTTDQAAAARERERKMRTLKRLSDALGRPIEDFYESRNNSAPTVKEPVEDK
ncbi:hypothetical protein [Methylobacterium sp. WL18]|uniref:hypothetical protein n=1 Tax=Methylobacterium sp. WL18 TaxID=2603897 RepID=UPI0011CC2284|nr:hypothetical protein [Methylobacterium sp. WL18]TXN67205.1 hypothetical protein FV228_14245 [Methylobacterium sp. WL18]